MALPAGPMISLTAALDGVCTIWTPEGGERQVPVLDFVHGPLQNALKAGELLRAVDLPISALRRRTVFRQIALSPLGRSGALLIGKYQLGLDIGRLRTLVVLTLVFGGEAILYTVRERRHLWSSLPGKWVMVASVADIVIISTLAVRGIAMKALPVADIATLLVAAVVFAFFLDVV